MPSCNRKWYVYVSVTLNLWCMSQYFGSISVISYRLNWCSVFVYYICKHKAFSDFSYWKYLNFWIHFWVSLIFIQHKLLWKILVMLQFLNISLIEMKNIKVFCFCFCFKAACWNRFLLYGARATWCKTSWNFLSSKFCSVFFYKSSFLSSKFWNVFMKAIKTHNTSSHYSALFSFRWQ